MEQDWVLFNEEDIKKQTIHIHSLLQQLSDKIYTDTLDAEFIAKHSGYQTIKDKYIPLRAKLNAYTSRLADICEVANSMYYDMKKSQRDIEEMMYITIRQWEEEHAERD